MTENNFEELGSNLPDRDEDFKRIVLIDEQGEKHNYNVLFTFDSEDYGKSYVLVYPETDEKEPEVNVEAYTYELANDGTGTFGDLQPIEDEAELDMVEEVLNTFMEDNSFSEGND